MPTPCDTVKQIVKIDSTNVGYGCTKDEAMRDFFKSVLAKIEKERQCSSGTCDSGTCISELVQKGNEPESLLHYNPARLAKCDGSGWKCFLVDESNQAKEYEARCTCAP